MELIVMTGGSCKSYGIAAKLLQKLLNFKISSKQVSLLTTLVGSELRASRDERTQCWKDRPLTQPKKEVLPRPQLACVQIDGGRMQTRQAGLGHGVHDPHWRETKNAGFHRMATKTHPRDPCPELPGCFSSRKNMGELLVGLSESGSEAGVDQTGETEKPDFSWRPTPLFRSCLSSLAGSDEFGTMMAAEADRRGFYTAERRAFLGDGLNYNWTIHRDHFPTFEPILDFIHPIEHLHKLSQALEPNRDAAWRQTKEWIRECWHGNVSEVIGILKATQIAIGLPPDDLDDTDPRKILHETIRYLSNNVSRMNYPEYRRQGLPITSCLIESQIKEMNHRIKGTEKFWNDGDEGEAILQVVTALLSDGDQLGDHFQSRPGSPYDRTSTPKRATTKH